MAQQDLLLALQILLDHDDLTEEVNNGVWAIAQLLGGFEHLGVGAPSLLCLAPHPCQTRSFKHQGKPVCCAPAGAQIRLLLCVLRTHVLKGEWDPTPALSYLEQLRMLAADASLPAYVDAANVTPSASLLMTVRMTRVHAWCFSARLPTAAALAL